MSTFFFRKLKGIDVLRSPNLQHNALLSKLVAQQPFKNHPCTLNPTQIYGQPTFNTHPHMIEEGNLVPGISVLEFQQRRERLMTGIQKFMRDKANNNQQFLNHILVVSSATKKYMSGKIPYFFRQNTDFFYLTGCLEPDTTLMLSINEKEDVVSTMFMRPKDKHAEMWDGVRTGSEKAVELFGVQEAFDNDQFQKVFRSRITTKQIYLWCNEESADLLKIAEEINTDLENNISLHSPVYFLESMRLFKSPAEIALMRQTCQIASTSINEVMLESKPGDSEHHISALIDYKCRIRNASHLAYPSVVATGNNATTIHYISNTQITRNGELVLMDAGCEYSGYSSDITRTWPINGRFSEPQKILYDVLLYLQKELLCMILKSDVDTLDKLFDTMCYKLGRYMQEEGLVPKHVTSERDLVQAGYKFCPHHVSHYLGMDVHDTPSMSRSLQILPGMVFTVEPGIYINKDCKDVPKEFRGIGMRIEDDVFVNNDNKIEILTANCVKDRLQIESMINKKTA